MSENITRSEYGSIREGLKRSQKEIDYYTRGAKKHEKLHQDFPWGIYDSTEPSFDVTFSNVIPDEYYQWGARRPENGKISRYLNARFADKKGKLIGLEIGGPGSVLFEDLNVNAGGVLFKRSAGVTLTDLRKGLRKKFDNKAGHQVIEADILEAGKEKEGKKIVLKWLNGEKADFIIERMQGAISNFPSDMNYFYLTLKWWYEMLSVNGVMLVQIPEQSEYSSMLEKWFIDLKQKYSQNILIDYNGRGVMRIEKLTEGPLPR